MEQELYTGFCQCCGQENTFSGEEWKRAEGRNNLAATLACNCQEAMLLQNKLMLIDKGREKIREVLGEGSEDPMHEDVINLANQALPSIVERCITGITIEANDKVKIKAGKTVSITRTKTSTTKTEIS